MSSIERPITDRLAKDFFTDPTSTSITGEAGSCPARFAHAWRGRASETRLEALPPEQWPRRGPSPSRRRLSTVPRGRRSSGSGSRSSSSRSSCAASTTPRATRCCTSLTRPTGAQGPLTRRTPTAGTAPPWRRCPCSGRRWGKSLHASSVSEERGRPCCHRKRCPSRHLFESSLAKQKALLSRFGCPLAFAVDGDAARDCCSSHWP